MSRVSRGRTLQEFSNHRFVEISWADGPLIQPPTPPLDQLDLLPDVILIVDKYKKKEDSFLLAELKEIQLIRDDNKLTNAELEKLKPEMIFENEALLSIYEKVKAVRTSIVTFE